jgi:chlorite dismutase
MPMEPVNPSIGWGVLHLLYRVDRERAEQDPGGAKRIVDAVASLESDGHRALVFVVLGHKADLGIMAYGPDVARLHAFQQEVLSGPLAADFSFVSLTELSEYSATEADERARLADDEGLTEPGEIEARLEEWRDRIEHYRDNRLHPQLPPRKVIGFYPMSKRRIGEDNWYRLSFDERKQLMAGHARIGRSYAGRVLQLITGSVGLDDWEWGVTLLADDPVVLKEIVNEMRFDDVSARYSEFGPFFTGLVLEPSDALERVGLQ